MRAICWSLWFVSQFKFRLLLVERGVGLVHSRSTEDQGTTVNLNVILPMSQSTEEGSVAEDLQPPFGSHPPDNLWMTLTTIVNFMQII